MDGVRSVGILLVFLAVVAGCSSSDDSESSVPVESSSSVGAVSGSTGAPGDAAALSVPDVERLEAGLMSGDAGSVLDVPAGIDASVVAAEMLPDGTLVTIDPASFVDLGGGFGAVEAVLSGPVAGDVTLFLRRVDGVWLVSGTSEPVEVP